MIGQVPAVVGDLSFPPPSSPSSSSSSCSSHHGGGTAGQTPPDAAPALVGGRRLRLSPGEVAGTLPGPNREGEAGSAPLLSPYRGSHDPRQRGRRLRPLVLAWGRVARWWGPWPSCGGGGCTPLRPPPSLSLSAAPLSFSVAPLHSPPFLSLSLSPFSLSLPPFLSLPVGEEGLTGGDGAEARRQ